MELANEISSENNDSILLKDVWYAHEIGLEPNSLHGSYYLNFEPLKTNWLKEAAKKFVRYQCSIRSFSTCLSYMRSFRHFDRYLTSLDINFCANEINRTVIIGFIHYLSKQKLMPMTRRVVLINMRTFHQIVIQESWLSWPIKPMIYSSDLPSLTDVMPRYITNEVMQQLMDNLNHLSITMQNFIIILVETGRRVSEVCLLKYDCLELDNASDYFLRVHEKKLSRIRLIPISKKCVETIKAQQRYVDSTHTDSQYLFPGRANSKCPTVTARIVNMALNRLANERSIKDANGRIWKFTSHQFRHTLGTRMINKGVPQVVVQHYLGHESPDMTARYAHVHNETLKSAFSAYQEQTVDIKGQISPTNEKINARWIKKNITTQALPNGACSLPTTQQRCPHANACLTCNHFRTSTIHLEKHKAQLCETQKIIRHAKQNGWQRIKEMNEAVAKNLSCIIENLEKNESEPSS